MNNPHSTPTKNKPNTLIQNNLIMNNPNILIKNSPNNTHILNNPYNKPFNKKPIKTHPIHSPHAPFPSLTPLSLSLFPWTLLSLLRSVCG